MDEFEQIQLIVKGMPTLEDAQSFLAGKNMTELGEIAAQAGIEKPASTKAARIDEIIAALTSGEVAATGDSEPSPSSDSPEDDQASSGQGVLPEEERGGGVSLPAKVANFAPDELWPQILGWELDQGLDEDARAGFSDEELREYLAYLWDMGNRGQPPATWIPIKNYEFKGLA